MTIHKFFYNCIVYSLAILIHINSHSIVAANELVQPFFVPSRWPVNCIRFVIPLHGDSFRWPHVFIVRYLAMYVSNSFHMSELQWFLYLSFSQRYLDYIAKVSLPFKFYSISFSRASSTVCLATTIFKDFILYTFN